jgi:hypothetical protein
MQQELVRNKGPAHEHLYPFVGTWKVEGHNAAGAPDSAGKDVHGIERFEWLEGEYFLANRFERGSGADHFNGLGWIGYDAVNGCYVSYAISNIGYFRIYQVQVEAGEIRYLGAHERGVVRLSAGGHTITIRWEQQNAAGRWQLLCDLTGHRVN